MNLYYAGIGAGIFYLFGDILGGIITLNYSYIHNAVSELIQSGAENRVLLSSFFFIHAIMIILFSLGIMLHHPYRKSKSTFIGGILLLAVGVCHSLSSSFFPMDPVGTKMTFSGALHLVLVGITVVSIIFLMPLLCFGLFRSVKWKSLKVFTFLCLIVILTSGAISPIVIAKGIEVMGLTERITGYVFYFWLFVLAYLLIRSPNPLLNSDNKRPAK